MVQGAIGPPERVETGARRRRGHTLQRHVFQYPLAAGLPFGINLFRRFFEIPEDRRIGFRLRVLRGVEPCRQCLGAHLEGWRRLPIVGDWRHAPQVVVKLGEMIEGMTESDKAGPDRSQISRFQGERFEEVLDMLDRLIGRLVFDEFAGEPAATGIDSAMSDFQDRSPGGLERDRPSCLGNDRLETADALPFPDIRTMNRANGSSQG